MIYSRICKIFLISIFLFYSVDCSKNGFKFEISVDSGSTAEEVSEFIVEPPKNITKNYQFGKRIDRDYEIEHFVQCKEFPNDVPNVHFRYFFEDTYFVSYANFIVNQSSDLGHGRILDGGILQKKVTFEILARETRFICVDAQFYGYRQSD